MLPKNPEIREVKLDKATLTQWVVDLRSGRFTQAKGKLRCKNIHGKTCHCCLGVLAERTGDIAHGSMLRGSIKDSPFNEGRPLGYYADYAVETLLASANDDGDSFAEIADWIETHLIPAAPATLESKP